MYFWGLEIGSWAEWFSGIATTAAVIVALWPLLRKPRPKVYFIQVRHVSSSGLGFTTIAYTNTSEAAGFFRLSSCKWKGKDGVWHEYYAKYFITSFSVMPFQKETEMAQPPRMAHPDPYAPELPKEKGDILSNVRREKVNWVETLLVYTDVQTNIKATMRFTNKDGVKTFEP